MPKKKSTQNATATDSGLSVPSAEKALPPDASDDSPEADLGWLNNGVLTLDETAIDPDLSKIPGRTEDVPIDSCVPNAWNPNTMDDKEFDMLVRRIREVGMLTPIQVVPTVNEESGEEQFTILGGEHRWRACKALGYTTIPATILTEERFQNKDLQKFLTMQLNMIHGKLDGTKFVKLYQEMRNKYADKAMADLMGFTKMHAFKLQVKGFAEGLPEGMREEFRKRADGVENPKQLKNILTDLLGKYGNDLRFNFMILSHEGKEHIWVRLSDDNHKLVSDALDLCRTRAIDVNVIIEEAFRHALERFTTIEDAEAA